MPQRKRSVRANPPATPARRIDAAVLRRSDEQLLIETLELEGPRDDEVLVRLVAAGICRTDVDLCDEWAATSGPVVLGHEGAGVVEQVGRKVTRVRRGDHVLLSYQSCGHCRACRRGHPTACAQFDALNFGFQREDGSNALEASGVRGHLFGQSSFATYALATERNIVKVARQLPLAVLAPLGCGIQTGAGTVMNSLRIRNGSSIAVFGTGSVGLAAVMAARYVGAKPIIGVDIIPKRLGLARELGATHTINSERVDISSRIREITGGGVDYVLEVTGDMRLTGLAPQILNPRGTVALIAAPDGERKLAHGRRVISII
jgi:aryl-alcohol dehydrogenase